MNFLSKELPCSNKCRLYKTCKTPCIKGRGNPNADIFLIGEAPGEEEDEQGKVFVGRSGKILEKALEKVGIKNFYITNAVACRPPNNREPTQKEIEACKPRLLKEIKKIKPKTIILLGNTALKSLFAKTKISDYLNQDLEFEGIKVYANYHPAALLRNPALKKPFLEVLIRAKKGLISNKIRREYWLLETYEEIKDFLKSLLKKEWVAFDIETLGLDYLAKRARLLSIAFSGEIGKAFAFSLDKKRLGLLEYRKRIKLLNNFFNHRSTPKLIGHNVKFDCAYLKYFGVDVDNLKWDTQLAHHLLNEEMLMPGLKELAKRYTDLGDYNEPVKGYMNNLDFLPEKTILTYNCYDADATFRIFVYEYKKLKKEPNLLWVLNNILLPASYVLMLMEMQGASLDLEYVYKLKKKFENEKNEIIRKLEKSKAIRKSVEILKTKFNFNSSDHLRVLLYEVLKLPVDKSNLTKTGLPSAKVEVLKKFSDRYKIIGSLLRLSKVKKMLTTYLEPAEDWLSSDGKVHTTYNLTGTVTGRLSSERPNSQNFPRDKTIKKMFIASPGNLIIQADYSQMELRVMACASRDKRLIEIYNKGLDAHKMAASAMYNVPYDKVTPEQRQFAKGAVSFGLNYGRGAKALARDLNISVEEAERFRRDYFKRYSGVARYIEEVKKTLRKQGYVESLFGRRRRLPNIYSKDEYKRSEAERQAVNFIIQSTASDITLLALYKIYKRIKKEEKLSRLIFTIHDSVVLEVPESEVDWCVEMLKKEMVDFKFDWLVVPLAIEIDIMKNWGETIRTIE